jgi:pyruvate formate lyase activating enzyme
MKVEAQFYSKKNSTVKCELCPHFCTLQPGKSGICGGRMNENGTLLATNYGETTSIAIDPIEKKPLYHFHPGSMIISIAPNSCNMCCPYCQNWEISQENVETKFLPPDMLVQIMIDRGSFGVAYTYTEPLVWFEYVMDAGKRVREAGGKNVLVTNGMINELPLQKLVPLIDAMNIDLKTMDADIYRSKLCGDLEAVKRTISYAREHCHIEITNLLVTGLNDRKRSINALIEYIGSLDPLIPVHFSRYYPNYRYDQPPTPMKRLEYAYTTAKNKGLSHVYLGNAPSEEGANTFCPQCKTLLIERMHFQTLITGLKGNKCKKCGMKINIITG